MGFEASPAVERAAEAAGAWAAWLGSHVVRLSDWLLGLLDEEEGRAAAVLERLGLSVAEFRDSLVPTVRVGEFPAPVPERLYLAARERGVALRGDPALTTDLLLLAVTSADPAFQERVAQLGLSAGRIEALFRVNSPVEPPTPVSTFDPSAIDTHETDAARILDVNLNRAREAFRVLDDYTRFVLNDRFLTEQLKALRHRLAEAVDLLPRRLLLASRDAVGDVGTAVAAAGEYDRKSPRHVATVNWKRLQESLRSLEEYGKSLLPHFGREVEAIRYAAYTLERAMIVGADARDRLANARLYLLVSGARCVAALDWTIEQAALGGVGVVQLREKELPDRELLRRARDVRRWTRQAGVLFVVNDRPDIARLAEADGVHLGQDDLPVHDARRLVGPDALIGVSTHTVEQVRQAVLDGADYLGIGPTFPSRTKPFDHFPGLDFIRLATAETSLPAFALGGITPGNVAQVLAAGAERVAVGSAIAHAADPQAVARQFRSEIESPR